MSRTYRTQVKRIDCNCGADIETRFKNKQDTHIRQGTAPLRKCRWVCNAKYDYSKYNHKRDKCLSYGHFISTSKYKVIWNNLFRAKYRHQMVQKRYDLMPVHKKTRQIDWW